MVAEGALLGRAAVLVVVQVVGTAMSVHVKVFGTVVLVAHVLEIGCMHERLLVGIDYHRCRRGCCMARWSCDVADPEKGFEDRTVSAVDGGGCPNRSLEPRPQSSHAASISISWWKICV